MNQVAAVSAFTGTPAIGVAALQSNPQGGNSPGAILNGIANIVTGLFGGGAGAPKGAGLASVIP